MPKPTEYTIEELKSLERDGWSEETFQGKVLAMAIGYGFDAVHFEPAYTGTINKDTGKPRVRTPYTGKGKGFPDTVAIHEARGLGLAWELKANNNKTVTPEQHHWLACFKAMGFDARVCYPRDWDSMMDFLAKGKR